MSSTATTDQKLLDALIGFVNDTKPYHSKLLDFTTELSFSDSISVRIVDNQDVIITE